MSETLWLAIGLFACGIGLGFIIGLNIAHVYGDDTEDKLGPTWQEWLQKRAAEWNINKLMNETLETAERFEPEK